MLILTGNLFSQSGWFWQNPLPQGNELLAGTFANSIFYAAGVNGTFVKTSDNGITWDILPLSLGSYLRSTFFINDLKGWVVSARSVYRTVDGGNNWQNDTIANSGILNSLCFTNENTGYLTTDLGKIYKSTNSGMNWSLLFSATGTSLTNISFVNENTGWVTDYFNKVYKTVNGGVNWVEYSSSSIYRLTSIFFIDANTGWMTNETGGIMKTTNGGINWDFNVNSGYISSVCFVNNLTGWTAGSKIDKTTDGGNTWSEQQISGMAIFNSIDFKDTQTGIAVGNNGIIHKTTNGGLNWNLITNNVSPDQLNKIFFLNDNSGWAAGEDGSILFTSNGGNNWVQQYSSNGHGFYSIRFLNQNTGWAAGNGLYKTTNHGNTWYNVNSNPSLSAVFPADSVNIFACGQFGLLLRSTNGGNNWTSYPGITRDLIAIYFVNVNTGWIGGSGQIILKTTNSGTNWINQRGGSLPGSITDIHFVDEFFGVASTAVIGGADGLILATGNGGITWNVMIGGPDYDFTSVYFIDANTGWFLSNDIIGKTINNGGSWEFFTGGIPGSNSSIFFINNNTGWVAGSNGNIMKTTTGGSVIGLNQITQNIPLSYNLHQNYPNPFNPITKIRFDIPPNVGNDRDRSVKVIIYDLLGREVTTLVNEHLKPGSYSVDWDGTAFASGVYFYSLVTDGFVETKRMVLVK